MLRLAQLGTRAFLLAIVLGGCTEARRASGTGGDMQTSHAGSGGSAGAVALDSGIAPNEAGVQPAGTSGSDLGAAGSGRGGSGGTACLPLPCPSAAPWSAAACACVMVAPSAPECSADSDCALVSKGCCSCPPVRSDNVVATSQTKLAEVRKAQCSGTVSCGPCELRNYDPLAPILHAGCVAQHCVAVDLRSSEISKCSHDSDCQPIPLGCCGANSDDPEEYVGLRDDADSGILECVPAPPCIPFSAHGEPIGFCASDGHCAVKRREKAAGTESTTCYSPSQDIDHAYDSGAIGCDCGEGSVSVCLPDSTGRMVALICQDKRWQAAEDGPCGAKKP